MLAQLFGRFSNDGKRLTLKSAIVGSESGAVADRVD